MSVRVCSNPDSGCVFSAHTVACRNSKIVYNEIANMIEDVLLNYQTSPDRRIKLIDREIAEEKFYSKTEANFQDKSVSLARLRVLDQIRKLLLEALKD